MLHVLQPGRCRKETSVVSRRIDLNLDLGEGFGPWSKDCDEEELTTMATSVNLACGFHAGDPVRMRKAVAISKQHGAAIGAHPGLPDLVGFGRRPMQLSHTEVNDYITYQIGALQGFTNAAGLALHHVKLHGELALQCNRDEASARAYVAAVASFGPQLPIYANPHSQVWLAAQQLGVRAVAEFYADLPLCQDGRRIPPGAQSRLGRHPDATPAFVRARVRDFLQTGSVDAFDGGRIAVDAATISVHTDEGSTAEIVRAVRAGIADANVELSSTLP
jgi:UPF0271 protein